MAERVNLDGSAWLAQYDQLCLLIVSKAEDPVELEENIAYVETILGFRFELEQDLVPLIQIPDRDPAGQKFWDLRGSGSLTLHITIRYKVTAFHVKYHHSSFT